MNALRLLTRSSLWAIRPEAVPAAILALFPTPTYTARSTALFPTNECPPLDAPYGLPQGALAELVVEWEAAAAGKPGTIGKGGGAQKIAVVPIEGVLTKDGPAWYGSSYDGITRAIESSAADPDVKHIILAVDSPGGEVTGCPETANAIAEAAKVKPVTAVVNGMAASAAYYLASQARHVVLTPSGEVGSVGVRMMHVDISKALENEGVKVTELSSGKFKTEWSPFHPLTADAIEAEQPRMDAVHSDFINAVSSARGERLGQQMRETRIGEGPACSPAKTH